MKIIKYKIHTHINRGTEDEPKIEEVFYPVEMSWNEANEETAKAEAYNGEYTIEDDGQLESITEPTSEELFNVLLGVTE